ncbi:Alpha/Beta hydrolase protein [Lentinula raphanica]|nr:Alpha/Beta hydrolase protein [Lentinula raphanica]
MALQVMDNLGIENAFAFGASQGGWIVVRIALLAPERILGLMVTGTSMDSESEESRKKGAWDSRHLLCPLIEEWSSVTPTPNFVIDDCWCEMLNSFGIPEAQGDIWTSTYRSVYKGDEGRKKLRVALICLLERDSLLLRLRDIKCPVRWLQSRIQGTQDNTWSVLASEHIKLFASSEAKLHIIEGGCHLLNASHSVEVCDALKVLVREHAVV